MASVLMLVSSGQVMALTQYAITDLGTLGGNTSYAYGINNNGLITGCAKNAAGVDLAFSYGYGRMHILGVGCGYGINDYGQVTGELEDAPGHRVPFLYSSYGYRVFPHLPDG